MLKKIKKFLFKKYDYSKKDKIIMGFVFLIITMIYCYMYLIKKMEYNYIAIAIYIYSAIFIPKICLYFIKKYYKN